MVIVETSLGLPYVYGEQTGVHVSEVDYVIEGDDEPAPELANPVPRDVDAAVGRLIAAEIEDGDCLQIGIGAMPNAVCATLLESGVRDLGVHTEMMTDGLAELYEAGRITGARKTQDVGKCVYTFALGSRHLYSVLDRNRDMHCCPVDYTNTPDVIRRNDRMVSINNTTQIDLQGQAASESDGHRHLSGTGGQLQFVRGAYASKGGRSFICLSSTYDKRGERRSRIVLRLTPGNVVTTPRTRCHVRRHRVRPGQPEGQVGPRAGPGPDRYRASGLPRIPGARRLRAPADPARLLVLTGAALRRSDGKRSQCPRRQTRPRPRCSSTSPTASPP